MAEVQTISLYYCSGPKALIQPFCEADFALFHNTNNSHIQQALKTPRDGGYRLKFQSTNVWKDYHASSVASRQIFLDLVQAMQQHNMQLLCCADLNIVGWSAGTLFFQRNSDIHPTQLAVIQLGHVDKVRLVQLPESEMEGLRQVLVSSWKYGVTVNDKYGIRGYKLAGRPWLSKEKSSSQSVDAYKMVIKMLAYMESNGWSRVVSFDCSISDYDADSLLFFRDPSMPRRLPPEICAIALERMHKIRLIGVTDEMTISALDSAVQNHWKRGISETNNFEGTRQIKCIGRPWCPQTTEENIASAKLICGVLQTLWNLGWRWLCAIDLSVSVADKSTFFLSRNTDAPSNYGDAAIGCLQPKGSGKVNLVSFPAPILQRIIASIQGKVWCVPLLRIEQHGPDCATVRFQCDWLHRSHNTARKTQTAKVYSDLIRIVGSSSDDAIFLGSADISGNCSSGGQNSSPYSLDTDAFFFSFLS